MHRGCPGPRQPSRRTFKRPQAQQHSWQLARHAATEPMCSGSCIAAACARQAAGLPFRCGSSRACGCTAGLQVNVCAEWAREGSTPLEIQPT